MTTAELAPLDTTKILNVFKAGVDGYGSYRIPALLTLADGRLLAVCEARAILSDHAQNKLVLKISDDQGSTWSEQRLIADAGENALNNPLLVQDTYSGDIVLMYQQYPATRRDEVENPEQWVSHAGQDFPSNVHEGAVQEGYEGHICRTFVQRSADSGVTWSMPVDVTKQVKRPSGVTCYAGGPGVGIQLQHGLYKSRLVMPFTQGPWDDMKVYGVYSDDGGYKWQYGDVAPAKAGEHANETQLAELSNGQIVLNARSFQGDCLRKSAFSDNGGQSWSALQNISDLIEPECQASIISLTENELITGLLYCGPAHSSERCNGVLKLSHDNAASWQHLATIYTGSFGYSSISQLDSSHIGVLFERDGYDSISFVRVNYPS